MTFYPENLKKALRSRGLTLTQAAKIGGMSENRLKQSLEKGRTPTAKQIEKLSDGLSIPTYALFYSDFAIAQEEIVDFRSSTPRPLKSGINTKRISFYKSIRDFLSVISERLELKINNDLIEIDFQENPEQLAAAVRQQLRLNDVRNMSRDKKDFFKRFRSSLSSVGIIAIQDHNLSLEIDGVALRDSRNLSHTIVVNSRSRNAGARSFTLAHEICHILSSQSAVSDNYQSDNAVERYCNEFASSLLLPRSEFFDFCRSRSLSFSDYQAAVRSATRLSEHFFTSISACLIRANALNLCESDYYPRFSRSIFSSSHPDTEQPSQMGGPEDGPPPGVIDRAFLGDRAVALISQALKVKKTSDVEIFQSIGLSRRRIRGLQTVAQKEGIAL